MSPSSRRARRDPVAVAGRVAAPVMDSWNRLARPTEGAARFAPSLTDELPAAAQRWLGHAFAPGGPLARAVILELEGEIKLGRWAPFTAVQVIAPAEGYVWAARTGVGPMAVKGFDRYEDGAGDMRWRAFGRISLNDGAGEDVSRSAAGRLALDAVFVPGSFLAEGVSWEAGADEDLALARRVLHGEAHTVELHVGDDGALRSARLQRWAKPLGRAWGSYPCELAFAEEASFDGVVLPSRWRASYRFHGDDGEEDDGDGGDDGAYLRARIGSATFL